MTASDQILLPDERATQRCGEAIAEVISGQGGVIYLHGDLGAGKTTLVRAILRGLGYDGRVVSPSYTLIEPYNAGVLKVFHMDLYRLSDPEELEYLGIRDLDAGEALLLIEWPEHGQNWLPEADMSLRLVDHGEGRKMTLNTSTDQGKYWWQGLLDHHSVG